MLKVVLLLASIAGAALGLAEPALAQSFPTKAIRIIVPYPPGGSTDVSARLAADGLSTRLHQPVVVENRAGAGGLVGADYVAKSPPDGYTLLWGTSDALSTFPAIKKDMPYQVPDAFTYVLAYFQAPLTVVVNANLPIHSIPELVAYAKANPGKLRFGSSGIGSAPHLTLSLFQKRADVKIVHVPYKGIAQAVTELLGGIIDMGFITPATIAPFMATGKLRMLAVTGEARSPFYPNIPTMKESGYPDVVAAQIFGLVGPAGIPPDVVATLQRAALDAVKDPGLVPKLAELAVSPEPMDSAAFKKLVGDDYRKWKAVAEAENIRLDE